MDIPSDLKNKKYKQMKKTGYIFILLLLSANHLFAQTDTVKNTLQVRKKTHPACYIVPSVLITYGVITRFSNDLQNFDHTIDHKIHEKIHRKYTFDDYIQYVPYVGIYGLDLCGVKAKHNFLDRTLVLGTSAIFAMTLIQGTKYLTQIERPDGSNKHSFPSGHTGTAFLGAHILFREYKDVSPWIGVAGYGFAVTTASMRMINRKHWFSDVVTGAGVGILCVELSYLMLPVWHKLFKIKQKDKRVAIIPIVTENSLGIGGVVIF